MISNCTFCGLTNRPYATSCAHCGRSLQDAAAADAKRREWDALPAALRADYEKDFDLSRERFDDHVRWLKRHRWTHTLLGAILVSVPVNAALLFTALWPIPIGLAIGAAAGFALNALRGGAYRGLALFLAADVLTVLLYMPFIDVEPYLKGRWLMHALVLGAVGGVGYYVGLKLEFEHGERITLG